MPQKLVSVQELQATFNQFCSTLGYRGVLVWTTWDSRRYLREDGPEIWVPDCGFGVSAEGVEDQATERSYRLPEMADSKPSTPGNGTTSCAHFIKHQRLPLYDLVTRLQMRSLGCDVRHGPVLWSCWIRQDTACRAGSNTNTLSGMSTKAGCPKGKLEAPACNHWFEPVPVSNNKRHEP